MLALITAFSCISSFLFGYDLGLMGGALLYIKEEFNLSEGAAEVVVGAAKLGAVAGTFLGGALMLYYGRRPAIAADAAFFVAGPVIMAVAWNVAGLVVGRVIVGIGIGVSAVVVPAYLGEVAPARARGRVVELYEVMLCLGMLMSALVNAALDDVEGNWRWMVGAPAIPALLMSLAVCVLPESPRWLVVQGRLDDALAVIHKVHTKQLLAPGAQFSTAEVENELMELWSSVEKDKDAAAQRAAEVQEARRRRAAAKRAGSGGGSSRKAAGGDDEERTELTALNGGGSMSDSAAAGVAAAWPPPLPPTASTAGSSRGSSRRGSPGGSGSAGCLTPVDDSVVLPVPAQLPRIRTRSTDRLYELGVESSANGDGEAAGAVVGVGENGSNNGASGVAPPSLAPPSEPEAENDGAPAPLQPSAGAAAAAQQKRVGFWGTAAAMMSDIAAVARGPESQAFTMVIVLAFFNQAFASTAIINYAPTVLTHAGVSSGAAASLFTSLIGTAKLAGVVIAFFLIDSAGRRPLLLWGSVGCAGALALLIPADATDSHALLVLGMCLFIFSFSISWAGVFWVLLSESFSMGAKSPAASAATAVLFLTGAAADMLFLSFHTWMGSFAFLLYACIAAAAALYVWLVVPETKGRTLQEVQDVLAGRRRLADAAGGALEMGRTAVGDGRRRGGGWRLWRSRDHEPV